VIAERGWVDAAEVERLTGMAVPPTLGRWVVDPNTLAAARASLIEAVASAGPDGIDVATLSERQRAVIAGGLDGVEVEGTRAVAAGLAPSALPAGAAALLAALEAAPWSPPDIVPDDRAAVRELRRRGLAAQVGPLWFATSAVSDAAAIVARLLADSPEGIGVGAVRDALGASRKHVVPLLEYFDATGVTRRRGDLRIGGPRLPQAAP
jgi:selenocysteine-specific elongation factor